MKSRMDGQSVEMFVAWLGSFIPSYDEMTPTRPGWESETRPGWESVNVQEPRNKREMD